MVRVVKCNDEAKTLSVELKKEIEKLRNTLNKLESNTVLLQKGEIWNGTNAYETNKSLTGHLDHDKTLLNKLEKCSESLETLVK